LSVTITGPNGDIVPSLVLPDTFASQAGTIAHRLLSGEATYTFAPAEPLTGSLSLLFTSAIAARAALLAHRTPGTFTLVESTDAAAGYRYVVTGAVTIQLDSTTRRIWTISALINKVT
jgi:hypothetical protein